MKKINNQYFIENDMLLYVHNLNKFIKFFDDSINVEDYMKSLELEHQKDEDILDITICMTYSCDLKCKYCFESDVTQNRSFSIAHIENVICFIKKFNVNKVNIRFFGGEPLLQYQNIINIMEKLNSEFTNLKIFYMIFTNGYSLTDQKIQELKNNGLTLIHLTLDGFRESHDLVKSTKENKPTFNIIYNNLKLILKNNIRVTLRINLHEDNKEKVFDLFDDLSKIENKQILKLNIRKLHKNSNNKFNGITDKEFEEAHPKMVEYCINKGLKNIILPYKKHFCIANNKFAFVVEPNGDIRKCTEEVGTSSNIIGHISGVINNELYKYIPKCNNCKYNDICPFQCPKHFNNCDQNKNEYFKKMILLKYRQEKEHG